MNNSRSAIPIAFLIVFPLSVVSVRVLSYLGINPLILAEVSPLGCPLKRFLGWDCPTCGLTRSILLAWNGDFDLSLTYHFGGILCLVLGILGYFTFLMNKHQQVIDYFHRLNRKPGFKVFWVTSIFLYSFWGFFLRNSM